MQQRGVAMESWGSFAEGKNNLFSNETLCAIGERHHKSAAQVTLRWLVQRGIICIPKSVHQERIEANIDIFDFSLTDEEMAQIAAMADRHLLITKQSDADRTTTTVRALDEQGRREELARILGGMQITDAALQAADALIAEGRKQTERFR